MSPSYEQELRKVKKARSLMLQQAPFFGMLALALEIQPDEQCVGVWTDGTTLGFNPKILNEVLDLELTGLICDAILRVIAGHPWRKGPRIQSIWNRASAEVTRHLVLEAGFKLPSFMPTDERFKGISAEYAYTLLQKEMESNLDELPPSESTSESSPSASSSESSLMESHWVSEVRPAPAEEGSRIPMKWHSLISSAKFLPGLTPGGLTSQVSKTLQSCTDWREVLANLMEYSIGVGHYDYSRPNPRYTHLGLYMPRMCSVKAPNIVLVRDSSGSVGQEYRNIFYAAVSNILEHLKPSLLTVLDVDVAVRKHQSLDELSLTDYDSSVMGGGGTQFKPAFSYIEEQGIDCDCLIYLTDLQGTIPADAPDYPVIWAIPEGSHRGKIPWFGDLVEIELI